MQDEGDRELAAFAKLLRCGAWREEMRAADILTGEGLPGGALDALRELVGTAAPTSLALGNALKRVQERRIDRIPRTLTRRKDGHGFAFWRVVDVADEASQTPERPSNAELLRGALTNMGYRRAEADKAISALGARVESQPLADLVREALAVLRKPRPT